MELFPDSVALQSEVRKQYAKLGFIIIRKIHNVNLFVYTVNILSNNSVLMNVTVFGSRDFAGVTKL